MIYWHVEEKSVCVYCQLKSCSSSEVAAMIEGVLRHCTDVDIEKQLRRQPWPERDRLRLLPPARVSLLPRLKTSARHASTAPTLATCSDFPALRRADPSDPIGS